MGDTSGKKPSAMTGPRVAIEPISQARKPVMKEQNLLANV
jgi:hypothetical protein